MTKGLELANGLAEAIRDFSERDQKAAKEMRAKTFAAKRAFERESGEEKEALEEQARELGAKKEGLLEQARERRETVANLLSKIEGVNATTNLLK